jgi:hypothetical protein
MCKILTVKTIFDSYFIHVYKLTFLFQIAEHYYTLYVLLLPATFANLTMTFIRSILLLALLPYGSAQLTCTLSGANDANDCMILTDGDDHCVWCTVDATIPTKTAKDFGFCVSEAQAEAMEKNIPLLHCKRYSGTDDNVTPTTDDNVEPTTDDSKPEPIDDDAAPEPDTDDTNPVPPTDDVTPATDDTSPEPATDDVTPPDNNDDHAVPDDFWTCLQQKTLSTCTHANCTWCDTKGGFGLCMTGPTAESASHSAWFKCHDNKTEIDGRTTSGVAVVATPVQEIDMTCVVSFYEHPTANECMTTMDSSGRPCQWCTILDMATVCLSSDQVEMGQGLGLSCENQNSEAVIVHAIPQDPYDPSCLLAYLEDSSESTCTATVDADGVACEYCTLQGQINMCLTSEQAAMGEQFGVTCNSDEKVDMIEAKDDPYDTSCLLAFLQDSSKDGCVAAVDEDGTPCEFCSLQGAFDVCLTSEQAAMGEQLGITCDSSSFGIIEAKVVNDDPYDPSCLLAYLQDQSKDACVAAVDEDNNPCEFCDLQGAFAMCLTAEQAAMGEQLGITCDETALRIDQVKDPYDSSCLVAFWSDQSEDSCSATLDATGNHCEYCSLPGSFVICLTSDQAKLGQTLGMECKSGSRNMKSDVVDPLDTSCALSYLETPTKDACMATMDGAGAPCEFCSLNGDYSMCLNQDQAQIGQNIGFACDSSDSVNVAFPDDFFECLEHYQEDDCRNSPCTWCNTQVGIGFCLAPAAAESTKQCTFFDCEFDLEVEDEEKANDIYDPVCLEAGIPVNSDDDTAATCAATNGTDGNPCVWCDAAGVFGLCLSSEQASAAGQYLQCNGSALAVSL